jgi:DNA-binding GntR family transcriptional regulator
MLPDDLMSSDEGSTKLERVVRILRKAILQGDLVPGQRLRQQELAERLGMSPTPIREVLRILEAEGLLVRIPYKGVYVAEVSPEESEEIALIRSVLEGLAVKASVPRLTDHDIANLEALLSDMERAWHEMNLSRLRRVNYQFHSLLYERAGLQRLREIIERLWPRFATDYLWMIPGRAERSIQQHRAILEAVKRRDADAAGSLMSDHILTAGKSITGFLEQRGEIGGRMNASGLPELKV